MPTRRTRTATAAGRDAAEEAQPERDASVETESAAAAAGGSPGSGSRVAGQKSKASDDISTRASKARRRVVSTDSDDDEEAAAADGAPARRPQRVRASGADRHERRRTLLRGGLSDSDAEGVLDAEAHDRLLEREALGKEEADTELERRGRGSGAGAGAGAGAGRRRSGEGRGRSRPGGTYTDVEAEEVDLEHSSDEEEIRFAYSSAETEMVLKSAEYLGSANAMLRAFIVKRVRVHPVRCELRDYSGELNELRRSLKTLMQLTCATVRERQRFKDLTRDVGTKMLMRGGCSWDDIYKKNK